MNAVDNSQAQGRFRVHCQDREARLAISRWLEESRLPWPGELDLTVHKVAEVPQVPDDREAHAIGSVTIQAGPPAGTVHLAWRKAPAVAVIHPTQPRAELWLTPSVFEPFARAVRSFLLVVLVFLLRRVGWHHVHGAALIDLTGAGWLLVAKTQSGKSTTTTVLASLGWQVATDDIGFMVEHGGRVQIAGFREPIALRRASADLLQPRGGVEDTARARRLMWPEEAGGGWVPFVVPERLLFPSVGDTTTASLVPVADAVTRVLRSSAWLLFEPLRGQEHLDRLAQLATQCRCYAVTVGPDLIQDPTLLEARIHAADLSQAP
ncbi:MAG: hypothetical protein ABR551_00160 [Gemmatimonadales bacterium]